MSNSGGPGVGRQVLDFVQALVAIGDGLDLEDMLQRVVHTTVTLLDADYGALGVLGAGGDVVRFVHAGVAPDNVAEIGGLPAGIGLLGNLRSPGGPIRLGDVQHHPKFTGFPMGHPQMASFLGTPIVVGGVVYGNLYVAQATAGHFSESDEEVLQSIALVAGVTLANAARYDVNTRRARWQGAVTQINSRVLAGEGRDEVAAAIVRAVRPAAAAAVAMVAVPGDDGRLACAAVDVADADTDAEERRWSVTWSRLTDQQLAAVAGLDAMVGNPLGSTGCIAQAAAQGQPVAGDEPTLRRWVQCRSAIPDRDVDGILGPCLALPLVVGDEALGVLALARWHRRDAFDAESRAQAEYFASQAALALSHVRQETERARLAVFEERDRIARDLHDLVIQRLFATGMMLETTARVAKLPDEVSGRLDRAVEELDATIREIRTTIFELTDSERPGRRMGLRTRVLAEVERVAIGAESHARPAVTFAGPVDHAIPAERVPDVIAAVREGVSNALRHGGGAKVRVDVAVLDGMLTVNVSDRGPGLPPGGAVRNSGLANLAERAQAGGGDCSVRPRPDGGVALEWWVPVV